MQKALVADVVVRRVAFRAGDCRCYLLCALLLVAHGSPPALAQASADPIEVCSEVADPGQRLACFDREAQKRRATSQHNSAAATPTTTSVTKSDASSNMTRATTSAPDDTIGLDGKQLSIKRKAEGIEPPTVRPFTAVLARMRVRPGHEYYFELDNGQIWESTDTEPNLFVSPHEIVQVRPGVLGAFFLKTQEGNSIRVHRLR